MARTTDGRFSYEEQGEPGRPAVIFLHGIGGAAKAFGAQLDALAPDWHALAWDAPGYGESMPLEQVSIPALAQALRDFLTALRLDRPVLVGHSIGGMIVQDLLATEPLAARAAVLFQTSAAFGSRDPAWAESFVAARMEPLDRGETMASMAGDMVAGMVGENPEPAGLALARDCIAGVPEATYRAVVRALIGFDRRADLAAIAVPTLLLAGDKDANAPHETMRKMAEKIPGAEFVCLAGAGHLAGLERPAEVNAVLRDFLERRAPKEARP